MAMQVIEEGPRNLVIKFSGAGPHTVDVSALSPSCEEVRITKIIQDIPGAAGTATLHWVATANVLAWQSNNHAETHCFESFGGLVNDAGAGVTGDVLYTGADGASLVVYFKKIRATSPWPN